MSTVNDKETSQYGSIAQRVTALASFALPLLLALYHEGVYRRFRDLSALPMTGAAGFGPAPGATSTKMVKVTVRPETAAISCSATEQAECLQRPWRK